MISPRRLLPLPLMLLALAGAGCGDERTAEDVEGGGAEAAQTAEGVTTAESPEAAPPSTEAGASGSSSAAVKTLADGVGTDVEKAPTITSPSGTPPTSLVKEDVVEGEGTAAKLGDTVEVRYTLVNWGGQNDPVDSSWANGSDPVSFPLEEGGLIDGWIKGVPGMKPGGRRLLVVPPEQGYGAQGTPDGGVPPNGTLIFVVDLVKAG